MTCKHNMIDYAPVSYPDMRICTECGLITRMDPLVRDYLIHCYLYYKLDSAVIPDAEFDLICKKLLESDIEHKLVSKEDLAAGTGYSISEYPEDIIKQAEDLLDKYAVMPSERSEEDFIPSNIPTWLLLGLYIDFGYARLRDAQALVQEEIKLRWAAGLDRDIFERYFKDHSVSPERFGINVVKKNRGRPKTRTERAAPKGKEGG